MKELTFETLLAVFEEMFGAGLFWSLVVACVAIGVLFIYIVVRERGLESRRLVRAELWAPVGAVAAIAFIFFITNSGPSDIGGPVDVIVLLLVGVAGAVGLTILAYLLQSLVGSRRMKPRDGQQG
ncbi:DUF5368 domain-containing protein [Granulosicoccaceae sp. 1_MG-2023]|nr:DUF5368 domain-containing protein [Granulosicoccaceae sp. 1_MG-2023]